MIVPSLVLVSWEVSNHIYKEIIKTIYIKTMDKEKTNDSNLKKIFNRIGTQLFLKKQKTVNYMYVHICMNEVKQSIQESWNAV